MQEDAREAPNELTNGGRTSLEGVHQLHTPMGLALKPNSHSKSEEPISPSLESPESTGQPAGARSCVAMGGTELGVSHSELRAPAGKALDRKQTAGRDRAITSKNLGAGSDLQKSFNFPPPALTD